MPDLVSPRNPTDLTRMQAILSAAIRDDSPRYVIHPGDLAWWAYHSDPLADEQVSYWLDGDQGFAVLFSDHNEVAAFCAPGQSPLPLIEWGREQLGPNAKVVCVSSADHALESELKEKGYEVAGVDGPIFIHDLTNEDVSPIPPSGLTLRSLRGEEEADARRQASHAAFKSTMDPAEHLERYLRLMRSPVYNADRDLVAVTTDGTVAAFMIWWPDTSGIAEIEPMGTDPAFHRTGVGRALMNYGFSKMREAGMTRVRVITDDYRSDAIGFYSAVGFTQTAELRFWKRP
ncbi:MAG TPA: GNAT family N-acetyltransferase [Acidimicrobiia bacterium]